MVHMRQFIQVYAPTEEAEETKKDSFYDQLQDTIAQIPSHDVKILIGDMNAQIDKHRQGLEHVIGPHGSGTQTNNNGERFILFNSLNNMCIGNTYFNHKNIHKKTWRSPGGSTANEIDYISIDKRWRSAILDVRVYRGADIGSDHHLLITSLRLRLKQKQITHPQRPFAVEKLNDRTIVEQYQLKLQNRFQVLENIAEIEDQWTQFKDIVTMSAEETIGRRRGTQREKWIQDRTWKHIDDRKNIKKQMEEAKTPEQATTTALKYRELDRQVKKSCRADKKVWLEQKGAEAQEAATKNDRKALYRLVREMAGTRSNSNIPIRDKHGRTLIDKEEQNARWVEHFKETLNQSNPSLLYDFTTEHIPEELPVTIEAVGAREVQLAVKALKNHKAAGLDQITGELLKHGGTKMIEELTKLLNNCWQKESVPEDWQKGIIIKIPKKGNLNDCNNWRGITLLSVPGKIFCLVLLQRLRDAIEKMLREEQAGFRRGRSCSEQIFTLRNIIEQSTELQQPVFINFIDFKKAFDSVHRDTLWHIVRIYGILARYINIFKSLYQDSRCCVRTDDGTTDFFNINTGVRQGCVLSPFLFLIAIDFVMRKSMKEVGFGIVWNDQTRLTDLDFADDIALIAETNESLQNMTNKLETEAGKIGLRINAVKTKIMQTGNASTVVHITTGQRPVEQVPHFTYLGSSLSNDGSIHTDVKHRIGKASAIFQRLQSVWTTSKIRTATKLKFYNTIVIPTAIYASETWKFTTKITQKLDAFHQRCLRKILGITYHDRITNDEILHRSGSKRLQDIVTERRMQLAGHILRLPHQRHAYTAIHWTPLGGKRKVGRPQKTWRQTFRNDIRTLDIKYEQIEDEAADRSRWKKLTAQCATMHRRN